MTKASLSIGILVILLTVLLGLGVYALIASLVAVRRNRQEIRLQQKQLHISDKKIEEKKAKLEELSNKIRRAGRKLGRIMKVRELKESLKAEHQANYELQMEIKRLGPNLKHQNKEQLSKKTEAAQKMDDSDTNRIMQKYPSLPKDQLQRMEIERSVARSLIRNNGGTFHISQVLRKIENLYPKHINPNTRIILLNEIKNWIERDPLCRATSTADKIQHYTFI